LPAADEYVVEQNECNRHLPGIIRRALLLAAFVLSAVAADASAQERSIRLRNFDALLTVNPDGTLDVVETLGADLLEVLRR